MCIFYYTVAPALGPSRASRVVGAALPFGKSTDSSLTVRRHLLPFVYPPPPPSGPVRGLLTQSFRADVFLHPHPFGMVWTFHFVPPAYPHVSLHLHPIGFGDLPTSPLLIRYRLGWKPRRLLLLLVCLVLQGEVACVVVATEASIFLVDGAFTKKDTLFSEARMMRTTTIEVARFWPINIFFSLDRVSLTQHLARMPLALYIITVWALLYRPKTGGEGLPIVLMKYANVVSMESLSSTAFV